MTDGKRAGFTLLGKAGVSLPTDGMRIRIKKTPALEDQKMVKRKSQKRIIPIKLEVNAVTELTPSCSVTCRSSLGTRKHLVVTYHDSGCEGTILNYRFRVDPSLLFISDEGYKIWFKGNESFSEVIAEVEMKQSLPETIAIEPPTKIAETTFYPHDKRKWRHELGSGYSIRHTYVRNPTTDDKGKLVLGKMNYSLHATIPDKEGTGRFYYSRSFALEFGPGIRRIKTLKIGDGFVVTIAADAKGTEIGVDYPNEYRP